MIPRRPRQHGLRREMSPAELDEAFDYWLWKKIMRVVQIGSQIGGRLSGASKHEARARWETFYTMLDMRDWWDWWGVGSSKRDEY